MFYKVISTKKFAKSFKRLIKSGSFDRQKLEAIVDLIASKSKLPANIKDHSLKGDMSGYRECHIEYNLLLIYEIHQSELRLMEIGTHSELFGK